jgi:hypothetical protein
MFIHNEILRRAYEGSYYTITGCGGPLDEWKSGYEEMMAEAGIGKPTEWVEFTGAEMNYEFELTGDNCYPDDLHFLAFPLTGLNVSKLAMFKLRRGDRWFDDIVDNNMRREGRFEE